MAQRVQFKAVTVDSVSRTAITVPTACSEVSVRNTDTTNDATMYDASSGGNSKVLRAGNSERFGGGIEQVRPFPSYRWATGDTVCWVQADAGTGPIDLTVIV
jgi:hypothetical protein